MIEHAPQTGGVSVAGVAMNNEYAEPEPVFVVGMNGSGTTMLLDNLGRHSLLYAFPRETRLIPYLIANQHRFGDLEKDENFRKLWQEVLGLTVFESVNGYKKLSLPADWREYPRSLAAVLDGVFRCFSVREGKQRWCEKTPQHVQNIQQLAELFPLARFIHVVRDGRDAAASFSRRWHRTPELTVFRWKKVVGEGHRQGQLLGPERYMEVRYEDLTTSPEHWLQEICRFLAVPFEPAVLQSTQPYLNAATPHSGDTQFGTLKPNSGNWKKYFTARKLRRLDNIAGAMLAGFGYESSRPAADFDPPAWKRRIWSVRDDLTQYLREIGLKLSGKISRPWSVILSKPFVAWRQRSENKY